MQTAKERAIESLQPQDSATVQPLPINGLTPLQKWIPSRFNARSTAPDGTLILYNSYTGAFSGFPREVREQVESMLHRQGFRARLEGLTKYLHERGFIVAAGTNELQRVRLLHGAGQHRSDRLEFILLSSEDCNFRCVYCYETFPRGTMEPWVRQAVVTMAERRMPMLNTFSVEYFGGEPLLGYEAIEEMAPAFKALTEKHEVYFSSGMTTNGYLLTPEVARNLLHGTSRTFKSRSTALRSSPTRTASSRTEVPRSPESSKTCASSRG